MRVGWGKQVWKERGVPDIKKPHYAGGGSVRVAGSGVEIRDRLVAGRTIVRNASACVQLFILLNYSRSLLCIELRAKVKSGVEGISFL